MPGQIVGGQVGVPPPPPGLVPLNTMYGPYAVPQPVLPHGYMYSTAPSMYPAQIQGGAIPPPPPPSAVATSD
jgi:hypothetical protein